MKKVKNMLFSLCLKGDINKAYDYLLANESINSEMQKLRIKYYNRFYSEKPVFRYNTKDKWVRNIMKVYYEYFILVLTKKLSTEEADSYLVNKLLKQLPHYQGLLDIDSVEEELKKQFNKRQFYFLGGITSPYRGPYIWSKEEIVEYKVELPDRIKTVNVHFLSEFIMQSWLDFATFGARGTGGWAANNSLYCVKDKYKLDHPDFMYSYLVHEAQHLADYEDFPSLCQIDLEYRAKLVELIYHPLNNEAVRYFMSDADNNRDNPHAYASHVLCSKLSHLLLNQSDKIEQVDWDKLQPKTISEHALILFKEHTKELKNVGNDVVVNVI